MGEEAPEHGLDVMRLALDSLSPRIPNSQRSSLPKAMNGRAKLKSKC